MAIKRIRKIKPQRLTKPNVLSFVAYTLILFFGTTIIVNMNPNANESYRQEWESRNIKPMQWIFLTDKGESHDLFSTSFNGEHASPEDWDYLFPTSTSGTPDQKPEYGVEINSSSGAELPKAENPRASGSNQEVGTLQDSGVLLSGTEENSDFKPDFLFSGEKSSLSCNDQSSGDSLSGEKLLQVAQSSIKTPKKAYGALRNTLEDRSVFITMVFEYLLRGDIVELPEGAVRYVVLLYGLDPQVKEMVFAEKSCMTPWGYEIDHGASILAYEQRADAPNICNLQRRSCKNGKLSGTFTQSSCDEGLKENVKKLPYHTYNTQDLGEYIQPPKHAKNENADFDIHGKLNPHKPPLLLDLPPENENSPEPIEVPQQQNPRKFCTAPRGEKVQAGHFTKSYRFQNGFTDIPCKVQLRLCVEGELEGTYQYPNCQPWETSYEDFLYGYMDAEEPSPQRLLKMLQTDFHPTPERGNNLSPEIIDQLLKILRE